VHQNFTLDWTNAYDCGTHVTERPVVHPPRPIDVIGPFPELQEHLLRLLSDLTEEESSRSTVCSGWSVNGGQ
jgi:hypothetical protein